MPDFRNLQEASYRSNIRSPKVDRMTYKELKDFIEHKMRMSHIYQPLLIRTLVDLGGFATVRHLAMTFLGNDESQIQYYERRLKEMPVKVLSKHNVIVKENELIRLNVKKLSLVQKAELKKICEAKMQEFISSRGLSVWDYRLLDYSQASDTLRYQVLKEGGGHCALCGATVNDRMLDIDHIIPRSKGGKTEYSNLQVLCSRCNRSKRNLDDTDFRSLVRESLDPECEFCKMIDSDELLIENDYGIVTLDKYPVTKGHSLIIPKRHYSDFFRTSSNELNGLYDLLKIRKKQLAEEFPRIDDFNVGVNVGQTAGQTIFHVHLHLIPRRKGDAENPRGGVRGVIPNKQNY